MSTLRSLFCFAVLCVVSSSIINLGRESWLLYCFCELNVMYLTLPCGAKGGYVVSYCGILFLVVLINFATNKLRLYIESINQW